MVKKKKTGTNFQGYRADPCVTLVGVPGRSARSLVCIRQIKMCPRTVMRKHQRALPRDRISRPIELSPLQRSSLKMNEGSTERIQKKKEKSQVVGQVSRIVHRKKGTEAGLASMAILGQAEGQEHGSMDKR